jgi:Uncharacterized conserved protein (DUF2249)
MSSQNSQQSQTSLWKLDAVEILDVRPVLEQGGEPFVQIIETAARVPLGKSLVLIAPFEPVPLYDALGGRGFSHATVRVAEDEWIVRFARER